MNCEWIFDGIGTEIISIIISLLLGGVVGFFAGRRSITKQKQIAKDYAKQQQTASISQSEDKTTNSKKEKAETNTISQKQVAGDHSEQIQTGSMKHE